MTPDMFGKILTSEPGTAVPTPIKLLIAVLVGFLLAGVYLYTHGGRRFRQSFIQSIPLLTVIAAGVTIVIGDNLVRAFGLIGAVAIVRFRTAIRNTRDMTYIFLLIVLGMSCGLGRFWLVAALLSLYTAMALVMYRTNFAGGSVRRRSLLLTVDVENISNFQSFLKENFTSCFEQIRLQSVHSEKNRIRLEYRVVMAPATKPLNLLKQMISMNQGHFGEIKLEVAD